MTTKTTRSVFGALIRQTGAPREIAVPYNDGPTPTPAQLRVDRAMTLAREAVRLYADGDYTLAEERMRTIRDLGMDDAALLAAARAE